jgi:hypothetical protein
MEFILFGLLKNIISCSCTFNVTSVCVLCLRVCCVCVVCVVFVVCVHVSVCACVSVSMCVTVRVM